MDQANLMRAFNMYGNLGICGALRNYWKITANGIQHVHLGTPQSLYTVHVPSSFDGGGAIIAAPWLVLDNKIRFMRCPKPPRSIEYRGNLDTDGQIWTGRAFAWPPWYRW